MSAQSKRVKVASKKQKSNGAESEQKQNSKHSKLGANSKAHRSSETRQRLHLYTQATLGAGNMRLAVTKPDGEDLNEWLAVNVVDFYTEVSLLYGCMDQYCTDKTCPVMTASPKFEFLWQDSNSVCYKQPTKCSAPKYIKLMLEWVSKLVSDPNIFPVDGEEGTKFPDDFEKTYVRRIMSRLFRVFGHLFHSHLKTFKQLGIDAHLNTSFKHFFYFGREFRLFSKGDYAPLKESIIKDILEHDRQPSAVRFKPKFEDKEKHDGVKDSKKETK